MPGRAGESESSIDKPNPMRARNIYLIGPMGAGKTTVGRRLAKLLNCEFIDTDQALEARTGVSVSYIFEIEGEAGFRAREAQLLAEVARRGNDRGDAVVATGGGVVLRADNRRAMRESGVAIYLRAGEQLLCARLQGCQTRPLLSAPDWTRKIAQLLVERGPLYAAEADHIVDVGDEPAALVANRIHDFLCDENHRQH